MEVENQDAAVKYRVVNVACHEVVLLELTPILKPVVEITELLRNREQVDYTPYLDEIFKQKELLEKLFT